MVLPEFINMPRGDLLDWLSVLARAFLLVAVLGVGWSVYRVLVWLKQGTRGSPSQAAISSPLGAP
jgi:hypothetical protein